MSKNIAITISSLDGLDSIIDPRFGRTAAFLIVDSDDRRIIEQIKNDSIEAAHGAGTGSAAIMSKHNVNIVISGSFGPKAYQALGQLGIEMRTTPDGITATEALDKLSAGDLKLMEVKVY